MSKLRAGASSFSFSPSASSFTPGGAAAPAPVVEKKPETPAPVVISSTPVVISSEPTPTPNPAPTSNPAPEIAESWDAPSPVESNIPEKEKEQVEGADDDLDDAELLAELANNPELAAELAAVQREEAEANARKEAALKRREEKKAAAAAAAEANMRHVDAREHLNIVFIGHVDAGKSTISGQIMLATGQIDERTIERYKREAEDKGRDSWYLAFILDSNEEEKAKGKTVEVGRAQFQTQTKRYTLLDAPGHKNYVPNMIGGAQQADVGVLVISARRGEFETGFDRGGQTREHAMLARTLGIQRLVVLVNKMDEKTVLWDKERFDHIESKLSPFLKKSGFNLKTEVTFCPVSGYSGMNIRERYADCEWYNGPCFLEILDKLPAVSRDKIAPSRVPVITRFKDMGSLFVLGKLEAGTLRRQDALTLMPKRKPATVKALFVDELEVDVAQAGENVLIQVQGLNEEDVNSGDVLCEASRCANRTIMFDAQIQVLDLLPHRPIITNAYQAVLHIHALTMECEISKLLEEHIIEKKTKTKKKKGEGKTKGKGEGKTKGKKKGGKKKAAAEAEPEAPKAKGPVPSLLRTGSVATVRIKTRSLVCIETFKDQAAMGRFTLRDQGTTICIGKVLKIALPRPKR